MHITEKRLNHLKSKIKDHCNQNNIKNNYPEIIAVSKTFAENHIIPLIKAGHIHFGENKLQEAEKKWIAIKKEFKQIQLHMVGKLQTNKAKKAVQIFDFIHSLDSYKLANKINQFENELNKKTKIFIQLNLGEEKQKSGINKEDLGNFYNYCTHKLSLNVIGLMCLPPQNTNVSQYFNDLKKLSTDLNLTELSMGMSSDFENAINCGSTFLRIGTMIFGERNN